MIFLIPTSHTRYTYVLLLRHLPSPFISEYSFHFHDYGDLRLLEPADEDKRRVGRLFYRDVFDRVCTFVLKLKRRWYIFFCLGQIYNEGKEEDIIKLKVLEVIHACPTSISIRESMRHRVLHTNLLCVRCMVILRVY